jgi:hypothetical protein
MKELWLQVQRDQTIKEEWRITAAILQRGAANYLFFQFRRGDEARLVHPLAVISLLDDLSTGREAFFRTTREDHLERQLDRADERMKELWLQVQRDQTIKEECRFAVSPRWSHNARWLLAVSSRLSHNFHWLLAVLRTLSAGTNISRSWNSSSRKPRERRTSATL